MQDEFNTTNEPQETQEPPYDPVSFNNGTPDVQPESQPQVAPVEGNMIAGIVGAVLGSLIGCVLWVVVYNLGYIAGLAGLAIGVCALKGYELLGKRLDIKGVIITLVIMIAMIFFANKLAWALDAYAVYEEAGWTFGEVFQELDAILEHHEIIDSYYTDLIIGYLLTAVSSFKFIVNAFKSAK